VQLSLAGSGGGDQLSLDGLSGFPGCWNPRESEQVRPFYAVQSSHQMGTFALCPFSLG
jgi:hypothetical protein